MVETVAVKQEVDVPMARVMDEFVHDLPQDLYIPPNALEIILDAFEGPLDFLLYLIRRHNMDILDIPIVEITKQYISYIDLMQNLRLELAAEYLVMAATLAEIKSRMLLPRPKEIEEEVGDPRMALVRRLQEYERFKQAAQDLEQLPRMGRDIFHAQATIDKEAMVSKALPDVDLKELILAMKEVMKRANLISRHEIKREPLSIRERMSKILQQLSENSFVEFSQCFQYKEGRMGVVVTFSAVLELLKQSMVEIVQNEAFSPIHLKAIAV